MKRFIPGILYLFSAFWLLWLFFLSNVFTMGYYTPVQRKLAISATAILLPVALISRRNRLSLLIAILLALLTWIPIGMLWVLDKKPYGM